MRDRIRGSLHMGTINPGDRLPSTRELAAELRADPRVIAAAYRELEREGLVLLRPRSGVYLSHSDSAAAGTERGVAEWIGDVISEGVARGIAASRLSDLLLQATSEPIAVAAIATTIDQTAGIVHELRHDYGLNARGVLAETLSPRSEPPRLIERARLLLTTVAHGTWVSRWAERLGKGCIVASVRPDLPQAEWLLAMRRPVYVVAVDPRFLRVVRNFLKDQEGADNVRLLTADDREAIRAITPDATTYITHAARDRLGRTQLPGRVLPNARLFAADCVRALAGFMARENLGKRSSS
ncbi:MAG: GntR family transcriptional regulator [Gemmatimonadota bacterium]|nr:GntR family transcriptional regulator [Gemmatimonadota bacterium]